MFFTREQILEIAERIAQLGKTDRDLPSVENLSGDEQFSVIQNGASKKTTIGAVGSLISAAISQSEIDIFNVTRYNMEQTGSTEIIGYAGLSSALEAVPLNIKRVGQIITYYDSVTTSWRMYRFKETSVEYWSDVTKWEEFTATSSLALVAHSGSYDDLNDTPTIATKVSDLTNDSGFITSTALNDYYTKTVADETFATQTSLAEKANASDIPSVEGLASQEWVVAQGYKSTISWSDLTEDSTHKFVTAAEKTAWSAKQDAITGAASSILSSNLTANKTVVVNSSGKIAVSAVTDTELSRLSGVTSGIQAQINGKQAVIADLDDIREGAEAGATAYQLPETGIPATTLASAVQDSLALADSAYQKPSGGITATDLASAVQTSLGKADNAYQKPGTGIPSTDMASDVVTSLGKADTAYQKPSGGIPSTDLSSSVQTSLGKADSAIQSHQSLANYYTKSEVDSAVATSSATFRGTTQTTDLTETQFLSWANGLTHDINDYVYWTTEDSAGNIKYNRYKYNGSAWVFEYTLNNSSFSAAEWAAIQSGITAAKVASHDAKYDKPGTGIPATDLATAVQTSLAAADAAAPASTVYTKNEIDVSLLNKLATKQDVISDLSTIRTNATNAATAVASLGTMAYESTGSYYTIADMTNNYYNISTMNTLYYTKAEVDSKIEEKILHAFSANSGNEPSS